MAYGPRLLLFRAKVMFDLFLYYFLKHIFLRYYYFEFVLIIFFYFKILNIDYSDKIVGRESIKSPKESPQSLRIAQMLDSRIEWVGSVWVEARRLALKIPLVTV